MTINTLTDRAQLLSGDVRDIKFRVLQPGLITIRVTRDKQNPHTDSGLVGTLALERPGSTKAVARVTGKVTDSVMLLQHQATADEVAVVGDWVSELANDAMDPLIFTTQIMGPVAAVPLQSASIAIGLLNLLLDSATAAANVHLHVESGPPGTDSFITWSPSVTSLLKGLPAYYFHVDDFTKNVAPGLDVTFKLKNLDSDPQYPRLVLLTDPLRLSAILRFAPGATIETDPGPDVDLQFLQIGIDVAFDGNLFPNCDTRAILSFNGIDISNALAAGVVDGMKSALNATPVPGIYTTRDQVRSYLDSFFSRLLRLDDGAEIHGYRTDQNALIVDYEIAPTVAMPVVAAASVH